jgi:hypothetical protein
VLAQAWREGSWQALLARVLAGCETEAMTEDSARAVGQLLAAANHDDIERLVTASGQRPARPAGRRTNDFMLGLAAASKSYCLPGRARASATALRTEDVTTLRTLGARLLGNSHTLRDPRWSL